MPKHVGNDKGTSLFIERESYPTKCECRAKKPKLKWQEIGKTCLLVEDWFKQFIHNKRSLRHFVMWDKKLGAEQCVSCDLL